MKVSYEGDKKQIEKIVKYNSGIADKYGLKVQVSDEKQNEDKPIVKEVKPETKKEDKDPVKKAGRPKKSTSQKLEENLNKK